MSSNVDTYNELGGASCPKCGSLKINFEPPVWEDGSVFQDAKCPHCKALWFNSYIFCKKTEDDLREQGCDV